MQKLCLVVFAACAAAAASDLAASIAAAGEPSPAAADSGRVAEVDFHRDIRPIFEQKCLRCHKPGKKDGGLDLSTRETLLKGGHSGPALVPGDAEQSLMLELVEFDEMPPRKEQPRVTKDEFERLRVWVDAGAPVPAATTVAPEPTAATPRAGVIGRDTSRDFLHQQIDRRHGNVIAPPPWTFEPTFCRTAEYREPKRQIVLPATGSAAVRVVRSPQTGGPAWRPLSRVAGPQCWWRRAP